MNPEFLQRENQLLKQKIQQLIVQVSQQQKELLMRSQARSARQTAEKTVQTDDFGAYEPAMKIQRSLEFSPARRVDFLPEGSTYTSQANQQQNKHAEELGPALAQAAHRPSQEAAHRPSQEAAQQAKAEAFYRPVLWYSQQSAPNSAQFAPNSSKPTASQTFSYVAPSDNTASFGAQTKAFNFTASTPVVNAFAFSAKQHNSGQPAVQHDVPLNNGQNSTTSFTFAQQNSTFARAEISNNQQASVLQKSCMQRTPEPRATEIAPKQPQQADVSISNDSSDENYGGGESQSREAAEEVADAEEEQHSDFDAASREQPDGTGFAQDFNQPYEEYAEYEEEFAMDGEQDGFQGSGQPFEEQEERFAPHFGGQLMGPAPGYQAYPYPYSYAGYADSAPLEPGEGL